MSNYCGRTSLPILLSIKYIKSNGCVSDGGLKAPNRNATGNEEKKCNLILFDPFSSFNWNVNVPFRDEKDIDESGGIERERDEWMKTRLLDIRRFLAQIIESNVHFIRNELWMDFRLAISPIMIIQRNAISHFYL